jgi:hypothetical protein
VVRVGESAIETVDATTQVGSIVTQTGGSATWVEGTTAKVDVTATHLYGAAMTCTTVRRQL